MTILANLKEQKANLLALREEILGDVEAANSANDFDALVLAMSLLGMTDNSLNKITAQINHIMGIAA